MENRIRLTKEQKIMAARIVLTVLLLIIGAGVFGRTKGYAPAGIALCAAAYLVIGWDIICRAVSRLTGRHLLDENFLVIVASAGACALGDFSEGVAVLLLYQIGEFFEDAAVERSHDQIERILAGNTEASADAGADGEESSQEQFISRFARIYTPVICLGALCLAVLIPLLRTAFGNPADWHDWIYRALTFLVISCPCAMVISIPLSFSAGIGAAGREGIYVRDSVALEKIAAASDEELREMTGSQIVIGDAGSYKPETARFIARRTLRIVRENIWFSIGIKVLCLILGALGYAPLWLAVFADEGVMILAVLNALRALKKPAKEVAA